MSIELERYIRNHVVEASRSKVPFNAWVVKVIKSHTRDIRHSYHGNKIDRVYGM